MRPETHYTAGELIRLLRSDVRALIVIIERHRDSLTPLEAETVAAIASAHGWTEHD